MTKSVRRLTITAAATAVAGAGFALLAGPAGIDLAVRTGTSTTEVTLAAALIAGAVAALAGWGLLALLERLTARALTVWTIIAAGFLLLSVLLGPTGGVSGSAKLGLAALHLAVGAVVIPGLRWSTR
ncbi:MAG: hypothetical protein HOU81_08910 [Hamadaea sp.]|uniref:DUF6069 family protein n=1 Tax=Hamadaea sp. TaxID=2024425 RepID=UPI00183379F1|nr:DUF6069 family protein [Hamadaea sp.]NUR70928.1 hypothetical protein [Hamadaea sp.]NUT21715.1 hypothetical protein [Hamadaea sp.]